MFSIADHKFRGEKEKVMARIMSRKMVLLKIW